MIEYLYALQKHGIKLGLETMRILLDRVGNPHRSLRVLHIGGTNGKGSTAAMVAAVLQHAGLRVGLYTSPHLIEFRHQAEEPERSDDCVGRRSRSDWRRRPRRNTCVLA